MLLPGGATETGMIPAGVPEEARARLLRPEIVGPAAVYLVSDDSRHLSGLRLVATGWSPEHPDGHPAASGIGVPSPRPTSSTRGTPSSTKRRATRP